MSTKQELPAHQTIWRHHNGNYYRVYDITNEHTGRPDEYPPMVSYCGANGKRWSKTVANFLEKMTLTDLRQFPNEYTIAAESYKLLRPEAHFTRDRKFKPSKVGLYYYLDGDYADEASYTAACERVLDAVQAIDMGAGMKTIPLLQDIPAPHLDMLEVNEIEQRGVNPVINKRGGACVWGNNVSNNASMPFVRIWVSVLEHLFTFDLSDQVDDFDDHVAEHIKAAAGGELSRVGPWVVHQGRLSFEDVRTKERYHVTLIPTPVVPNPPIFHVSTRFAEAVLAMYPESQVAKLVSKEIMYG